MFKYDLLIKGFHLNKNKRLFIQLLFVFQRFIGKIVPYPKRFHVIENWIKDNSDVAKKAGASDTVLTKTRYGDKDA